ncbi:MAG: Flp pilus assembly protein CpaB [Armatimonadota bacterium]|nr:Flp pilus assembly protein CpaB [Armatimonadota bacterium]
MKKTRNLLLGLAAILAILAFLAVSSTVSYFSRRVPVVVAKTHILAGAVLTDADVEVRAVHPANVPAGALTSPAQAVGQRVRVERWPGDILVADHLGEAQVFDLAPDEVAIAISVDRITGLSGLLRPGDRVTVIGVIASANLPTATAVPVVAPGEETTAPESPLPYAHIYLRGMRVLFVHHEFQYSPPQPVSADASSGGLVPVSSAPTRQAESGVVVLAAPVGPRPVPIYSGVEAQMRFLSPAELLALLNSVAKIHLALDPMERMDADAYGVRLSELLPISSTVSITQPLTVAPIPPPETATPAPETPAPPSAPPEAPIPTPEVTP